LAQALPRTVEIAKEFAAGAARDGAQKVVDKIHLPYWDWTIDPPNSTDGCMPESLLLSTGTVSFPNSTKADISNPIYQFDFFPHL
jgi:tyrosinase